MTCTDRFTGRRRDIVMELIPYHLGTHDLLSSPSPVTAYCTTGKRDEDPASKVTATDWLRVFNRTEVTHPRARAVTTKALNKNVRKLNEIIAAAAGRLTDAFRASTVHCDRPHAGEMMSFW